MGNTVLDKKVQYLLAFGMLVLLVGSFTWMDQKPVEIEFPEQLSIAGFENSPFSRQTWPKLTTANQPNKEIAKDAANLLISQIRKKESENVTSQYVPQLVVRDSTGRQT